MLNTDENNSQVLTVTVDYMNQFLGGGNDYETEVTLTLDFQNAQKVESNFDFTPVNDVNKNTATDISSQSKENTSLSSGTKYAVVAIVAVIIAVVIVVLIIKKEEE